MTKTWTLTDESKSKTPEHNDKWIKIILSTDRIDKDICRSAVVKMYAAAEKAPPKVGFVRSPVAGHIAAAALAMLYQLSKDPLDSGLTYCDEVKDGILKLASEKANSHIGPEAAMDVMSVLQELAPAAPPTPSASSDTQGRVQEVLSGVLSNISKIRSGGNEWGSYDCYLTFVRDVIGFSCPAHEHYAAWEDLAVFGGVRWVAEDFCLISDRPLTLVTNQNNVLDNDKGPAKEYADGFKLWYLEGVQVDEQIVMSPKSQTVDQILAEGNEEVRRLRITQYGDEFFREVGAQELDRRENAIEGTRETLLEITGGMKFLRTFCPSTGDTYILPVDEEITTCNAAQSWLWGVDDASMSIVGRT